MGSPWPSRETALPRFGLPQRPVLVFDIDAADVDISAAPARRCRVKLLAPSRKNGANGQPESSRTGVSAVVVLRALPPSRLLSCVRAVTDGEDTISPERLLRMLPDSGEDPATAPVEQLTEREFAVLRLLADGDSTRDIAGRLSYSERTVKNIVHGVLVKLNCRTRAHAVALATRRGVI
jgi:DNA-binding NarL/FixJ family response regulator